MDDISAEDSAQRKRSKNCAHVGIGSHRYVRVGKRLRGLANSRAKDETGGVANATNHCLRCSFWHCFPQNPRLPFQVGFALQFMHNS